MLSVKEGSRSALASARGPENTMDVAGGGDESGFFDSPEGSLLNPARPSALDCQNIDMATVLIGGGSGLIGKRLSTLLVKEGHEVRHFSRNPKTGDPFPSFAWDPAEGSWDERALNGVDYLINLAGAGIADERWTDSQKQVIIESRTHSTALMAKCMASMTKAPRAFLSASAIGYYGDRGEALLDEASEPGSGFLSESVQAWEQAIWEARDRSGVRTVAIRIGLVLSLEGGTLPQLLMPVKFFSAPYFGDGRQWMSWIHIDDLCRMFIWALEKEKVAGLFNGVAPNPERQKDFMDALGKVWNRPTLRFPIPAAGMRLAMGEMAELVLGSTRVSAEKIRTEGFTFSYPHLEEALKALRLKA